MGFYDRVIGPALIACACSAGPISRQREKVVPLAAGDVLELGMGAGANLPFYDRERVTGVFAVEPNAAMRARAEKVAAETALPVSLIDGVGEHLPYDTGRFDCVVCTFTLCSVGDPGAALAQAKRVLKPGGRLLYCEHGLSPDPNLAKWQRRWEPLWKRMAGGCHLTRPITSAIEAAGFKTEWTDSMVLPGAPAIAAWSEWGSAAVA